jgi:hypothetical protein
VRCWPQHQAAAQEAAASFYLHRLGNQQRQSDESRCSSTGPRLKSQLFRTDSLLRAWQSNDRWFCFAIQFNGFDVFAGEIPENNQRKVWGCK